MGDTRPRYATANKDDIKRKTKEYVERNNIEAYNRLIFINPTETF